jgi:hypothetical protein
MATEKKTIELEKTDDFLIEAANLAREIVTLRTRLANAKREHTELLAQRDDALREGIDVLPQVRELFLEIDALPAMIDQRTERMHWIIGQGVDRLNAENHQMAAGQYMKCRDNLRQALERFREALASVLLNVEAAVNLGPSLTEVHNTKLGEIEKLLGNVQFPRVTYRMLSLPPLDHELVRQNQPLAALDRWLGGLQ